MLLESIAAGALGTLAGMIEKPIAQYMDLKAKKLDYEHIEAMQEANHDHDKLMAEKDLLGEGIKADASIMEASYNHDLAPENTSTWVNNVRALVRPATVVGTYVGVYVDPEQFLSAFMLCLTWYFASRVRSAYPE